MQLLATVFMLAAFITGFFSPLWGWVILAVPEVWLVLTILSLKRQKLGPVAELSPAANDLVRRFGHFYSRPFAGRDHSAACSALMFGGALVGLAGLVDSHWWGLGVAAANWFGMGPLAREFNPTLFFTEPEEVAAHEEIVAFLQRPQPD